MPPLPAVPKFFTARGNSALHTRMRKSPVCKQPVMEQRYNYNLTGHLHTDVWTDGFKGFGWNYEMVVVMGKPCQGITQDVLLEINIGNEESKSGFAPEEIMPLVDRFSCFSNIRLRGLMAIPPVCEKSGGNDKFFQEMLSLAVDITAKKSDNVSVDILSMGMSDDYADAIACGSTMIRVGTAIFGARDYSKPHQA